MVEIAENYETSHFVFLTEKDGYPLISVYKNSDDSDDKKLYEEPCASADDCENTTKQIYLRYLFPVVVSASKYDFDDDNSVGNGDSGLSQDEEIQDCEDIIYEREDELILAMQDFLEILLNCKNASQVTEIYGDEIVDRLLDSMCRTLAEEHHISVYRPMWVEDEDGTENFVEYPYLGVDDEDSGDTSVSSRK